MIFYKTLNDFLLKESTYSDFIENNNDRINTNINTLKELQSLFSSYTDDSAEQDSFINTLEDTLKPYDKDLYYFILNTILTRSNVDTVSLGNLGVELQNNYGTEPIQILNAIEDCASNLLNVEPLEDIQDENTRITENMFSDESLYHDINFMDLNKKYIDFLKYHNIDYNSNEIYKNIFNFFELELSAYKLLENNSDNINEGFTNNLKKVALAASIIATLASCTRIKSEDLAPNNNNSKNDTSIVNNPIDTITKNPVDTITKKDTIVTNISINGKWTALDQCRIDQGESFEISENIFKWNTKSRLGDHSTNYYNIKNISTLNDEQLFLFDYNTNTKKITLYTRVSVGGEILPNFEYRTIPGNPEFNLYVNSENILIFDNWKYKKI